ncbi:regulatory protein RecX [Gryllotalpicola ginsengisoli]|uniref:regulatory protein RecX n=1 Tax=Gryllotalpicola ginsengisoli TaxID=444608 RepID=UPI0003B3BA73|nr:regulatory protein RecX [Gryllotalpicola ginsengisoli]
MVVRFFPSDEERSDRRRSDRSGASGRSEHGARPGARPAGAAPIAYLPGAEPSAKSRAAAAAVQAVADADAAADAPESGDAALERVREKAGRRALNVSTHQLARRGMSRWELQQVLRKRGVEDEVAEAELDRLESVGLLDDDALAVSLVYAARARKGQGRQAIERELRRRHIDDDAISAALADFDEEAQVDQAIELAIKRVGQLRDLDDATAERRLFGYLHRRGYPTEVVCIAVGDAMRTRH